MAGKVIALLLRLGLAGVFLYAGYVHVSDAPKFVMAIQHYRLLPTDVSFLVGIYLPWVEILAGLGLVTRLLYAGSLAALGGMLVVFLGAVISAWSRGLDIDCGCFKTARSIKAHFPSIVAQDVALLVVVLILFVIEAERQYSRARR